MKNLTKIVCAVLFLTTLFTQSCEKESVAPEPMVSEQALKYFAILNEAEAKAGIELGLTAADLQAEMNAAPAGDLKVEICCYTASDLTSFLGCFGLTNPACIVEWDLNGDGQVNSADLVILLGNFGCVEVEALTLAPLEVFVTNMNTGRIDNETLIDGVSWYDNYDVSIFDNVRWYYDGVPVSNNPYSLQLEYPGGTNYDVAIDCNSGYHLIELHVLVDCEVYTTSQCVKVGINASRPLCTSNYCS